MIEVGEYIRTNKGFIIKLNENNIVNVFKLDDYVYIDLEKEGVYFEEDKITKHSKDIIDLIEVGDYVNGMRVIATENRGRYNEEKQKDEKVILTEDYDEWTENGVISNEDIKTILTHELYKQNCYKVVE